MKLALTNLTKKAIAVGIAAAMVFCLSGCGNATRHDARQKFKEKIAAIKVCTQGSTYPEFRQAEMDLKTSYEVNKAYLGDVSSAFDNLNQLISATDACWSYSINNPRTKAYPGVDWQGGLWQSIVFLAPEMEKKAKVPFPEITGTAGREGDPDFIPKKYVQPGLTKINGQAETILNLLDK